MKQLLPLVLRKKYAKVSVLKIGFGGVAAEQA